MSELAPTSVWRVLWPAFATTLAVLLLLLAFLGFNVHQRIDGYVEVEGTIQNVTSGAEVGLDVQASEVAYEIDGSTHVGLLLDDGATEYAEDDTVRVMAPVDGSPFSLLRLPASAAIIIFGWLTFVVGLGATIAGTVWLVRASTRRNRALRELTWSGLQPNASIGLAGPIGFAGPVGWTIPAPSPLPTHGPGLSAPPSYDLPESTGPEPTRPDPTRPDEPPPTRAP